MVRGTWTVHREVLHYQCPLNSHNQLVLPVCKVTFNNLTRACTKDAASTLYLGAHDRWSHAQDRAVKQGVGTAPAQLCTWQVCVWVWPASKEELTVGSHSGEDRSLPEVQELGHTQSFWTTDCVHMWLP